MAELERLDDDIASLIASARGIDELEPSHKSAVLAATLARVGALPGGGDDGAAPGGGAGPPAGHGASAMASGVSGARLAGALLATFALGVGAGVVVDRATHTPQVVVVAPSVTASVQSPPAPAAPEEATLSVTALPSAAETHASPRPAAPAVASARGLAAERALLDVARSALGRGEPSEALAAVDRHTREYPDGTLVEEREALAIKALVALGRRSEAKTRAEAFEKRFPRSLLLRAVKAAVDGL